MNLKDNLEVSVPEEIPKLETTGGPARYQNGNKEVTGSPPGGQETGRILRI